MLPIDGYIDQHPNALRLTVVEGSLDRSQFVLLAGDTRAISGVRVEATVIGASHVVSFDVGPFVLHEVFACAGLPDVASWSLDDLVRTPLERQLPEMRYEFVARASRWQDPEPAALLQIVADAERYAAGGSGIGVVQHFPAGEQLVTPKTVIVGYADKTRRGVVIESAHSYPNVRGLVLSRSVLYYA